MRLSISCLSFGSIACAELPSVRQLDGGVYAVFRIPHTSEAISAFYVQLSSLPLQFDYSRPVLERYECVMVECGECELMVPVLG